jgi:DNA polymerase-3 subunit beta
MITVPTRHLKAALLAVAKNDARYYICGVLLETMSNETRCVATNGDIAVVTTTPAENAHLCAIIIPRNVVELAVKSKRENTTFEPYDSSRWLMNGSQLFTQVDGKFPDYRRIFPKDVSRAVGEFNPELFALFGKMAQALGRTARDVVLHHNGTSTAAVSINGAPEFAGVISPLNLRAEGMENRPGVAWWASI